MPEVTELSVNCTEPTSEVFTLVEYGPFDGGAAINVVAGDVGAGAGGPGESDGVRRGGDAGAGGAMVDGEFVASLLMDNAAGDGARGGRRELYGDGGGLVGRQHFAGVHAAGAEACAGDAHVRDGDVGVAVVGERRR